jgi:hypothetical protein
LWDSDGFILAFSRCDVVVKPICLSYIFGPPRLRLSTPDIVVAAAAKLTHPPVET